MYQTLNGGKLFQYAKFQNEADKERKSSPKPNRQERSKFSHKSSFYVSSHSDSHIQVNRAKPGATYPRSGKQEVQGKRRSEERPLIDLSDEVESTNAANLSRNSTKNSLSLFDTLMTADTELSIYRNVELPRPLIGDPNAEKDPFDLAFDGLRYSGPSSGSSNNSRSVTPIQQGTSSDMSKSSTLPSSSALPSTSTSLSSSLIIQKPYQSKKLQSADNHQPPVPPRAQYGEVSVQNLQNLPQSAASDQYSASGSRYYCVPPSEDGKYASVPPPSTATSSSASEYPKVTSGTNRQIKPPNQWVSFQPSQSEASDKNAKAFDWLNDQLSNFSLTPTSPAASPNKTFTPPPPGGAPLYDSVPPTWESFGSPSQQRKHEPVVYRSAQYDEVPVEVTTPPNPKPLQQKAFQEKLSHVLIQPRSQYGVAPGTVAGAVPGARPTVCPTSSRDNYKPMSDFADDEWDSFESDDSDHHPSNGGMAEHPPPLPPRDYLQDGQPEAKSSSLDDLYSVPRKPRIHPVKQEGVQLSHTHYFLLPDKQKKDGLPANTAAVKPFSVDGTQYQRSISAGAESRVDSDMDPVINQLRQRSRSQQRSEYENLDPEGPPSPKTSRTSSVHSENLSWSGMTGFKAVSPEPNHGRPSPGRQVGRRDRAKVTEQGYQGQGQRHTFSPSSSPRDKVQYVLSSVLGVTDDECHTALCHAQWNCETAIRYLKVEQLFRLGVASRDHCEKLLEALQWDLELASSVLLDGYKDNTCSQCVSTV